MTDDRNSSTGRLLRDSIGGSERALDALLECHLPALRVYVRLHAGDFLREQESCSDIVQSVCRELLQGLDEFEYRGEGQFRTWLYTAALNKIRQHDRYFRAEKRDPGRVEPDEALSRAYASVFTPSREAMARETMQRIEKVFHELPEHYRDVITLSRVMGLSQVEIAERMGRTVPSVRNLLNRALVRIAGLADE